MWALVGGFVLGMLKLTCQILFGAGKIESPAFLAAIGDFNFLYASGVLFVAAAILMVVGSLATAPPPAEQVDGLTYKSIHQKYGPEIRASWDLPNKLMARTILVLVAGLYLYFSFWLD
jgi:SSS family solute:Na+ symporter